MNPIEWLHAIMLKYHIRVESAVYNEETKYVKVYTRPTLLVVHDDQITLPSGQGMQKTLSDYLLTPLTLATWKGETYLVFGNKMGKTFEEVGLPTESDGFPNLWYHCDFAAPKKIPH
jgi:hypothetical protein